MEKFEMDKISKKVQDASQIADFLKEIEVSAKPSWIR
jgi:hypothetical protein